jgi:hypothetical protein
MPELSRAVYELDDREGGCVPEAVASAEYTGVATLPHEIARCQQCLQLVQRLFRAHDAF